MAKRILPGRSLDASGPQTPLVLDAKDGAVYTPAANGTLERLEPRFRLLDFCCCGSVAFAASVVWASKSRRAAARSCSSRADRSRSCCRDVCNSDASLFPSWFSRDIFRRQRGLRLDVAPSSLQIFLQP